jgi:hypothetical protein
MRWTRRRCETSIIGADGEVVWSWRPDAGAKRARDDLARDGGKKARSPGRSRISVCRGKARFLRGCESLPARVASAGSNRSSREGNDPVEASDGKGHSSDSASVRAVTRVNVEQASKRSMWRLTWRLYRESCHCWGRERQALSSSTGVVTTARTQREPGQHGRPCREVLSEGPTGGLRRPDRARRGVGWARSTDEAG